MLRNWQKGETDKKETMLKCPVCGGALEEGFVQCSHRMSFTKKYRWFLPRQREGEFLLPFYPLKGTCFPAQYCENCDTITILLKEQGD